MSVLYIIATPIGNLKDISLRAIEILKVVDLILCEDTRVTRKLLERYNIKTITLSYHQHSTLKKVNYIIGLLKEGKNLALVSDSGTPGVSDPGGKLINTITASPGLVVRIVAIPGASAVTAAASISGFPMEKFLFLGFPPKKRKRKKFFEEAIKSKYPVIFYESPHRIIKTLKELDLEAKTYLPASHLGSRPWQGGNLAPKVVVCRELTKKFETIYRGKIEEVIARIEKDKIKGEFVVIVEGKT